MGSKTPVQAGNTALDLPARRWAASLEWRANKGRSRQLGLLQRLALPPARIRCHWQW